MRTAHRSLVALWPPLAATLLALGGCGGESGPTDPLTPPPPTVRAVVEATGWFPEIQPDSSAHAEARFDSLGTGDDDLVCTVFEGEQDVAPPVLTMLAAADELQHPGAILQWGSLRQVAPLPVLAARAGAELTLTAAAGGEVAGAVGVVDPDTVAAWRQAALAGLGAAGTGSWQQATMVVHGDAHLALAAGVDPGALTPEAAERLALREGEHGQALVRLVRPHHTVAASYPGDPTNAFAPEVTGNDLSDQMAEGNPPVWLHEVTYGELVLVLVDADATFEVVGEAARNTFAALAGGAEPDPALPTIWDLPGLEVKVFAVGADADALETAAAAGATALAGALAAAPADPGALPAVTASLLALRNGGPVSLPLTASFSFTTCAPAPDVLQNVLWSFAAADAETERRAGDLDLRGDGRYYYDGGTAQFVQEEIVRIPDLDGTGGVAQPGERRPMLRRDLIAGREVIEFYELPLPQGTIQSQLRFNGTAVTGRNYTVFAVYAMPPTVRLTYTVPNGTETSGSFNGVNYFLHGTDPGQLRNLLVGYSQRDVFVYSHNPRRVEFVHEASDQFRVYAFRFSFAGGMSVWADGELLASDATDTAALQAYFGATLGARWYPDTGTALATFWLAEIIAYGGDVTDGEIVAETARLRAKYGLDR